MGPSLFSVVRPGGLDHVDEAVELGDGGVDIDALLLQQIDSAAAFLQRHAALRGPPVAKVVEVDHLAYVGEAETDPYAPQDPGEPRPVAPGIDARDALPSRRDQPLVLVEPQRPGRDPELLAKVADRVALGARLGRLEVGMKGMGHGPGGSLRSRQRQARGRRFTRRAGRRRGPWPWPRRPRWFRSGPG